MFPIDTGAHQPPIAIYIFIIHLYLLSTRQSVCCTTVRSLPPLQLCAHLVVQATTCIFPLVAILPIRAELAAILLNALIRNIARIYFLYYSREAMGYIDALRCPSADFPLLYSRVSFAVLFRRYRITVANTRMHSNCRAAGFGMRNRTPERLHCTHSTQAYLGRRIGK